MRSIQEWSCKLSEIDGPLNSACSHPILWNCQQTTIMKDYMLTSTRHVVFISNNPISWVVECSRLPTQTRGSASVIVPMDMSGMNRPDREQETLSGGSEISDLRSNSLRR